MENLTLTQPNEKEWLITEFVPNREYIDCLVKNNRFQKNGMGKTNEFSRNDKRLRELERQLTSEEIIRNAKLAFEN